MSDRKVVVAKFSSPVEAEIARTQLEDADIWCSIADAGIVATDPLLGVAVGGIRLMVFESDQERAAELLLGQRDGSLDHDDSDEELEDDSALVGSGLQCPSCGSDHVRFATIVHAYWSAVLLVAVLPIFAPREPAWDWLRALQCPAATTMIFVGIWATILRVVPLQCSDCGERGGRRHFQR